jgi:O-antigen ligase
MLIGVGMASSPEVPEGIFDWRVIHPHSIYLTQFYLTGMIGLAMLVGLIAWAMAAALALARSGESLWLCLLSGGCLALWFDGGQVFTVYSSARIELLLVAVPLAIVLGKGPSKDVRGSLP